MLVTLLSSVVLLGFVNFGRLVTTEFFLCHRSSFLPKENDSTQYFDHTKISKDKQIQNPYLIKLDWRSQAMQEVSLVVTIAKNEVVVAHPKHFPSMNSPNENIHVHHRDTGS